jgi:hypothetical protein
VQEPAAAESVPRTGHAGVDAVLDDVEVLDGRPPADQVPVFEAAHDRLRDLLAGAGDPGPQPAQD